MPQARGEVIRRRRQERGIKASELAGRVGIKPVTMLNIENAHNSASIEVLYRIAAVLELSIEDVSAEAVA